MAFDSSQPFEPALLGRKRPGRYYRGALKRGFDLALVLVLTPPALLILTPFALAIWLSGGAPFYSQLRIGRNGRPFRMWKLRSMQRNADALLAAHLAADPQARREWQRFQKLRNDPRITRIGRFIRRSSIDELPQLWNVLTGDMSFVGPRPMLEEQRAIYPGTAYYQMRPGLSGYWQIAARNEASFAERAVYDSRYFQELSFLTDLTVILRTFRVVLRGAGC